MSKNCTGAASETAAYMGWIAAGLEDREVLEQIGVRVGTFNRFMRRYEACLLTFDAREALERMPAYSWQLWPVH